MVEGKVSRSVRTVTFHILILLVVGTLMGCSVKLISSYDETTDKETSRLQKQTDEFITTLIVKGGDTGDGPTRHAAINYSQFESGYEKIGVDLRSLEIRTAAISSNEHTTNQVKYIIENFDRVKARHKSYSKGETVNGQKVTMSNAYLRNARDIINEQFKSVLSLELAKKQIAGADSKNVDK